eukprot:9494374-Pyramimonas_sp.AAC.1
MKDDFGVAIAKRLTAWFGAAAVPHDLKLRWSILKSFLVTVAPSRRWLAHELSHARHPRGGSAPFRLPSAARRDRPLTGARSVPASGLPAAYFLAGHCTGAPGSGTSLA